ncbi:MAG: hypothetical protein IKB07_07250 [Lachnospiraceae bacterium]|nr:hypothetical protein [Lachnospiraceae bacterium]
MLISTIDIIEQADKFLDVALYSIGPEYNDGFYVGDKILDDELMKYLFPKEVVTATVNCAFSCELYIKSMLNEGNVVRGHKLEDLFNQLDDKWKGVIIRLMEYEEIVFCHFLKQSSNAFEKWRYIYEREEDERRIYFVFLKKFAVTLQKVAYGKYHYAEDFIEKIDKALLEESM